MRRYLLFLFILVVAISVQSIEIEFDVDPADESALPAAISKAVSEAYDQNRQGLDALEKKQFDAALAAFTKALVILPDYSDAENNRGVVYFRKGNVAEAQDIWEKLAIKDTKYAIASYNLGLIQTHERNYEAALRLFERAVKIDNRFVEALLRCGTTNFELGHPQKGFDFLHKAYKVAPKHPDTWYFLAYGFVVKGDTSGALGILESRKSDPRALRMMGMIESSRKNGKKAVAYLSEAVAKGADPSILAELAASYLEQNNCNDALASVSNYFSHPGQYTADAYLTGGIAAKECGNIDEALNYFSEGIKRYPSDPILSYNLGQIYFHKKQYDKAGSIWDGLSDSLQDPSLLYFRAIAAQRQSDYNQARELIMRALAMDDRAEFHDFLGVIYYNDKQTAKAEAEFRKAIALNPELRSAQLNLSLIATNPQELDTMIREIKKGLASCSGDSCAMLSFQMAIMYYHRKELQKAVEVLNSIEDSRKDERTYRHIALFHREMHNWDKAIATLEKAAKDYILEPQTEYELAETYLLSGNYAKAADRFKQLIPRWAENPWRLYYQMGYAWLEQNNLDQAQASFEKSIKSKHDNIAARGLLAFVLNRKGNTQEARKLWEKNLQDDPDNPAIWINMGLSLEREKNYDGALSHYKKALLLKPGDNELQINIGNAYLGMNNYVEAINAYSLALQTSKRNLAAYNIFIASIRKKDITRAEKMLELLEKEFSLSPYTRRSRAEMALFKGNSDLAKNELEALSEKEDADLLSLARIYATAGNEKKARSTVEKVTSADQWKKEIAEIEALIAFSKKDFTTAMRLMQETGDTTFTARYNTAVSAYHSGQFRQALDIATRLSTFATGKDRADVCRLAGNSAFSLKLWNEAKQWYLQLSNVESDNAIVQYNLAVAFYNLANIDDAWKYYQRAKGYDASLFNKDIEARYRKKKGSTIADSTVLIDSADIWYNNAVELQTQGDDTAAEKLYKKVIAADSTYSLAWNNLGAVYGKRGDIDNAESAYFKAIEKRHDVPETYANLVNLYLELEEFTKARKWIIKGIGHNPDSEVLSTIKDRIPIAEKEAEKKKKPETGNPSQPGFNNRK